MTVQVGLPAHLLDAAAALYLDAFSDKLGPLFGRDDRARRFLAGVLRPDRAVVALDADGRLVGLAGFHLGDGSFVGGAAEDLRRAYGIFGALWRGPLLSLFEREAAAEELLVDGVVVAPAARGRGVGGALIEAVAALARREGLERVRLEVVDSNPRARALYARRGFETMAVRRLPLMKPVFGFAASETMALRV